MADINQFIQKFSEFKSTFKITSLDTESDISLCQDESMEVINFDYIIEKKYPDPQGQGRPKSFDALYFRDERIYCIEFKNQKPSKIINKDVKDKFIDGKKELEIIFQELNIQKNNYQFIYCVCYKNCSVPWDRYKCGVSKGAIEFGLRELKESGKVSKVFTNNVEFFTKQINQLIETKLQC